MAIKSNIFDEYRNKNSVNKRYSRYSQGGETKVLENRLGWWERELYVEDPSDDFTITIPKMMEYKPSLVAKAFLGRDDLAWLVLQYNDIVDVFDLKAGTTIKLPSQRRALSNLLSKPKKYAPVKKFKPKERF